MEWQLNWFAGLSKDPGFCFGVPFTNSLKEIRIFLLLRHIKHCMNLNSTKLLENEQFLTRDDIYLVSLEITVACKLIAKLLHQTKIMLT